MANDAAVVHITLFSKWKTWAHKTFFAEWSILKRHKLKLKLNIKLKMETKSLDMEVRSFFFLLHFFCSSFIVALWLSQIFNRILNLCLNAHIDGFTKLSRKKKTIIRIECFTFSVSIKLAQDICDAMTNENAIRSHETLNRNWLFCHWKVTTQQKEAPKGMHNYARIKFDRKIVQANQFRSCCQTIKWLYVPSIHWIWIWISLEECMWQQHQLVQNSFGHRNYPNK